jgi:iron complex transport system substrate-binding protein
MSGFSLAAAVVLASAAFAHAGYPVTVTNCGLAKTYTSKPTRAISQNQGTTEFMLAMGLEGYMVGTAYIDDEIWPQYAEAYNRIPVLATKYATEEQIEDYNADFIAGSYTSAFYEKYYRASDGKLRGVFNTTLPPCVGEGSEYEGKEWRSCRPQLHAEGIGTFLLVDYCEDTSLRPDKVTEDTVYSEMRSLGEIFDVSVQPLIDDMKKDFELAARMVAIKGTGVPLKTAWIDCMGCCDSSGPNHVFVGAGDGAPNMLMEEAGLTNAFANTEGNWACVPLADISAAAPDIIVVVDADWDSGDSKIEAMYDDAGFCELDALKHARFVKIPFSATTLSPRNGPAALDLAIASLHVRAGENIPTQRSGVTSFTAATLQSLTAGKKCPVQLSDMVYTDAPVDGGDLPEDITNYDEASAAFHTGRFQLLAASALAAWGALA